MSLYRGPYRIGYQRGLWDASYKAQVFANSVVVDVCCHEHDCAESALLCAMELRLTLPECPPPAPKPLLVIRCDDGGVDEMAPTYSRQHAIWEDERLEDGVLG